MANFREQIQFLLGKVSVPTASWTDVWRDQHDAGFMVAGAYKAQLVDDLFGAVQKAILEKRSLADFRKDFDQVVARHGWTYHGTRGWRTRLIYETNMRASYQAGRYAQLTEPAFLRANPYWRYHHSDSVKHPRPEHLALNGRVVRADSPWWGVWYPPNGWGCQCTVFAENDRSLARKGFEVSEAPPIERVKHIVGKSTGNPREVWVPKGIDPGWDYAPGATRAQQLRASIGQIRPQLSQQLSLDLGKAVERIPAPPPAPLPPGGKAVADALLMPGEKKGAPLKRLLEVIDQVHGDGDLPKIPVHLVPPDGGTLGAYVRSTLDAKRIEISRGSKGPEMTLAHELGHFIDHQVIGGRGYDYTTDIWKDWLRAVEDSQAIRTLRETDADELGVDRRFVEYLLRTREIWARSYAQYIAETSADPVMLEQLTGYRDSSNNGKRLMQWTEEDFKPIREAIDAMFKGLGWLRSR